MAKPCLWMFLVAAFLAAPAVARDGAVSGSGQTALPSPAGKSVAAIRGLAPGAWLDLGSPQADRRWGKARGRAWTSKMAFSRALGGAFLFGEGVHGWANPANGRYMDGLWFYDANAHRWVSLHAGTDTRNPPNLVITADGFEGVAPDRPMPVATMVHGYEMTAWDPARQLFFSMPNHHTYYRNSLSGVGVFRDRNSDRLNRDAASPWIFDPWNRRWHRYRTSSRSPRSGYGNVLMYMPSRQKLFFYAPKQVHFYDPGSNQWERRNTTGPKPPFGIDPVACHDPARDRIYVGGGAYPVAPGSNALWVYDVKNDRWINPAPAGSSGGNHFGTNIAILSCNAADGRVLLFRYGGGARRGIYVYDPRKNAWGDQPEPLPAFWPTSRVVNGFYHPDLGVQFIHIAGDSADNGRILVYRPRR